MVYSRKNFILILRSIILSLVSCLAVSCVILSSPSPFFFFFEPVRFYKEETKNDPDFAKKVRHQY